MGQSNVRAFSSEEVIRSLACTRVVIWGEKEGRIALVIYNLAYDSLKISLAGLGVSQWLEDRPNRSLSIYLVS